MSQMTTAQSRAWQVMASGNIRKTPLSRSLGLAHVYFGDRAGGSPPPNGPGSRQRPHLAPTLACRQHLGRRLDRLQRSRQVGIMLLNDRQQTLTHFGMLVAFAQYHRPTTL